MASHMHTLGYVLASFTIVLCLGLYYLLRPPKYPLGIPAIPFWVTLLPLVKDIDQEQIFRHYVQKPLQTHGAVKIFFASQWNVLVHRPSYLVQLFKQEDDFQKSGNNAKIPHSVLASFLGDNIISSHGSTWKIYRDVVQPGLQRPFEHSSILANARRLCHLLCQDQAAVSGQGIPVQEAFQRYTTSNLARVILETDFDTLQSRDAYLHGLQVRIKREIFKPLFMNFPVLDRLGLASRKAARKLASHFTDQLVAAVERSTSNTKPDPSSPGLAHRLVAARTLGQFSEQQFRDNLTISFVAGQENPQLALLSIMYLLAKHPHVQELLYHEVVQTNTSEPSQELLQEMKLLTAVILESLRLMPPIGQLVNRRAAQDTFLGTNMYIPRGTYLGYNSYSTNRDPQAWGPDPDAFVPQRWGATMAEIQKSYRRRRARAEFISFHGGRRACLGERFAMLQLKVSLFVLIKSLRWRLDPSWKDQITPAGPICPRALKLIIESRDGLEG